jgi:hypothetical protein
LDRLQASQLWDSVLDHLRGNRALQQQADERTARCRRQSAAIFDVSLGSPLWGALATHAGLLPAELAGEGAQGARAVAQEEEFEYQEPCFEMRGGRNIIKGTHFPFVADQNGGPLTKYAALFDKRAEYDCLRVSFLHAAGGPRLQLLQDSLFEYLDTAEDQDADVTQGLWTYRGEPHALRCRAARQRQPPRIRGGGVAPSRRLHVR